ncbi:WbuC family cupin fold metalloprotein [Bacteroides faecium]|uniref:Cupin fold metalloprotein, WbuC family n=1 Tax=Bacteroides faecium TaxID=2715212 RepID=A0A6H0KS37_9BACE|nr:WbuC family cupin fold metalloprotein [Bacteroides faecium]QIU96095.1 cupin fold metalloprotein, WbuC family [Bacteroides faecium]
MDFDKDFLERLFEQAIESPRLRQSFDLRTSSADSSQRILNALLSGTVVPIHRHLNTSETVICLCGKMDEVIYEESDSNKEVPSLREVQRIRLCPAEARYGCQVPMGAWHTVEVIEPSVIFEAKDGAYAPVTSENVWSYE